MLPELALYMCFKQALVVRKAPSRWIASSLFQSANGKSTIGFTIWIPALLTSTSIRPYFAMVSVTAFSTAVSSATFMPTAKASEPFALISRIVASAASRLRSAITGVPPSVAKRKPTATISRRLRQLFRSSQRNGSGELGQESLGLFQIGGIEALGEPAVDGREQISCRGPPDLFAPEPRGGRRGAQLIGLCLMSSCDAQRFFEGALALFDAVETVEGDAFEAMKLCVPLPSSCFLLRLYPLPHRGERRPVLALPRQRFGQPGKAVGAKHHR